MPSSMPSSGRTVPSSGQCLPQDGAFLRTVPSCLPQDDAFLRTVPSSGCFLHYCLSCCNRNMLLISNLSNKKVVLFVKILHTKLLGFGMAGSPSSNPLQRFAQRLPRLLQWTALRFCSVLFRLECQVVNCSTFKSVTAVEGEHASSSVITKLPVKPLTQH